MTPITVTFSCEPDTAVYLMAIHALLSGAPDSIDMDAIFVIRAHLGNALDYIADQLEAHVIDEKTGNFINRYYCDDAGTWDQWPADQWEHIRAFMAGFYPAAADELLHRDTENPTQS